MMQEAVLHYLWKFKKLLTANLTSVDGQNIKIISTGIHNANAGPDFLNACIELNGIVLHGNIELHVHSSDWKKHKHEKDSAYNNVILHVVYTCDCAVFTHAGDELVQLELKQYVAQQELSAVETFLNKPTTIACANLLHQVPNVVQYNQKEKAYLERLALKQTFVLEKLKITKGDWEQVCYQCLARAFGTNLNQHGFERLTDLLTLKTLRKEAYSLLRTEAILFYYSGLLQSENNIAYVDELKTIAQQCVFKYNVTPMQASEWKFSAARPNNFPTIRLAQFANLVYTQKNLFSALLECEHLTELKHILHGEASAFWDNHYTFTKPSAMGIKNTGDTFLTTLVLNAVIPLLFTYAKMHNRDELISRCIAFAEELPAEKNNITSLFKQSGFVVKSAFDSQACIQLKNSFCDQKKCLSCSIGIKILGNGSNSSLN